MTDQCFRFRYHTHTDMHRVLIWQGIMFVSLRCYWNLILCINWRNFSWSPIDVDHGMSNSGHTLVVRVVNNFFQFYKWSIELFIGYACFKWSDVFRVINTDQCMSSNGHTMVVQIIFNFFHFYRWSIKLFIVHACSIDVGSVQSDQHWSLFITVV